MTISRVGAASALADTVVLPPHAAGDIILMFAYRSGVRWPRPNLPAGWTNLDEGATGLNSSRVAYKIAASSSETCGIWAGASGIVALVYRCEGRWKPPQIAVTGNAFNNAAIKYPDLPARPGGATFVRFAGHRSATDMLGATPAGWTAVAGQPTRVRALEAVADEISAAAVGENSQTVNDSSSWRTATVSLAEAVAPPIDSPIRAVWDRIPAVATVFTLSGLSFNLYNDMPFKFQGIFAQAPYTMKQIKHPASLFPNSITDGVDMLDKALLASTGPVIVLTQSQGSQVASRWMDVYADDPVRQALASRIVFVMTGNPLRATGNGGAIGEKEVDGKIGVPTRTDTVWPVVDVASRWDGWADYPNDTENAAAVKNALIGRTTLHVKSYAPMDIYDPTHGVHTVGNTTFVLSHGGVPPLLADADEDLSDENAPAVIAKARRVIESAYDRSYEPPSEDTVEPEPYWDGVLARLGIE